MRLRFMADLLFCLALLTAWVSTFGQTFSSVSIAITHVTIIDPGTSSVETDRTVLIRGNRVASVSSSKDFHTPSGARVIDGSGKFLIPGLWDMHVHTPFPACFPPGRYGILPLSIAN